MAQLLHVRLVPVSKVRQNLVPALVRDRPRPLRHVAEDRQRAATRAAGDHPQLHRREILRLVDDHMVVGPRRRTDEGVRLVEQRHVRVAPPRAATPQEPLLVLVEGAFGRSGQEGGRREEGADELFGRHRGPGAVQHAREVATRLQCFLDLFSVPDGGSLKDAAVFGVEAADDSHPEALPRRRGRAVLLADLGQEPLLLADPDADVLPIQLQDQLLGLGREPQLDRTGDHLRQARVGLQAGDRWRIDAHRRDAGNEVRDRELLDTVLAERR